MFELELDLDIDEDFSNPFKKDSSRTNGNGDASSSSTSKSKDRPSNETSIISGKEIFTEDGNEPDKKTRDLSDIQECIPNNQGISTSKHSSISQPSSPFQLIGNISRNRKSIENNKKSPCNSTLPQRKFPGPAGLLPDKPPKDFNSSLLLDCSTEENSSEQQEENLYFYSQSSASIFTAPPYKKLMCDFNMNECNCPLNKYTIDWVKKKALSKKLYGRKIPFLAVVLHHVDRSTPDPVLILRDPSGEIYGTLHREVWNDMCSKLHPGAAIVLKQVGVLTTGITRRQVYLNITINNIVTIYSSTESSLEVEASTIQSLTSSDLIKSVEDWQAQARSFSSPGTPAKNSPSSLFKSVVGKPSQSTLFPSRLRSPAQIKDISNAPRDNSYLQGKQNVSSNINIGKIQQSTQESSTCNFDVLLSEEDFDDMVDFSILDSEIEKSQNKENPYQPIKNVEPINFVPKCEIKLDKKRTGFIKPKECTRSSNTQFQFCNQINSGTNFEKMNEPTKVVEEKKSFEILSSQVLTPAESQIFEEVLSGIDLDDFDL